MVTELKILNFAFVPISDDQSDTDIDLGDVEVDDLEEEEGDGLSAKSVGDEDIEEEEQL